MMTHTTKRRKQLAFRFDDAFIARIKRSARDEGLSLNDFAFLAFDKFMKPVFPILPNGFHISDEIRALSFDVGSKNPPITDPQEQVRHDKEVLAEALHEKYYI